MVTVEYKVPAERQKEFEKLMDRYGRVRRRDGAYRWGIFRDMGSDPEGSCWLSSQKPAHRYQIGNG